MRTVAIVFAVILVFLLGVGLASVLTSGSGSSSPTPVASQPSAVASAPVSAPPSVAPTEPASPSSTPASSPSASASASAVPAATVMFRSLALDATTVAGGNPRYISFTTDGPGSVQIKLASVTTGQVTHMCLRLGSKDLLCTDKSNTSMTGTTKQQHGSWRLSLQGKGNDTPVVDVTITFNALSPKVTITHARFDGTSNGPYNGIIVAFTTRVDGQATLDAQWGGHPFLYEVDLFNETTPGDNVTLGNQGPATGTTNPFPVKAAQTYRLVLQNIETGFGATDMTASVSWP
ncbi:MAG TPA: hypothetical protein VEG29_03575 [Candidatus Binatia bacterium]|nr:hypothetical protein [Candidatus Binatia bacterium]